MKSSKALSALVAVSFAAVAAVGLVGCSGASASSSPSTSEESGPVAATVNGTDIYENTVTEYIENYRASNSLDTDEAWGAWLASAATTPSDIRTDVIEMFISEDLVKQAAKEKNIEVTDEEVDEQISQMRANYSDDEAWQAALEQVGMTEDEYRQRVRDAITESKLQEKVIEENGAELTDEEVLEQAAAYAPYFDGARKSSHILFNSDSKEQAQQVLDQINNGEITFEDAVSQYSEDSGSAADGGNVGWDMLNSFVTEYTEALAKLDEGQTSDLVESEFGYHIIRCTEVFKAPEEVTSLDQLPSELVEYIRSMLSSTAESTAYSKWLDEYRESADVKINDMPSGLPYDIDASLYETTSEEGEAATDDAATVEVETEDGKTTTTEVEKTETSGDAAASDTEKAAEEGTDTQTAETEADKAA